MARLDVAWDALPWLIDGLAVTVELSVAAIGLALPVGVGLALLARYGGLIARVGVRVYVDIVRGTPILVQILLVYYVLPRIGVQLVPFWAGVAALALNSAAYVAEIVRGGFLAIPKGQIESGQVLGLSGFQVLRRIVLPQLAGVALPPLAGELAKLVKASSIVSVIAVVELTRAGQQVIATTFAALEIYATVGFLYLLLSLALFWVSSRTERWATTYR